MAFTTIKSTNIAEGAITTAKISATVSLGVKISNVAIANSSYTVLDDTAVALDGGYIVITGSGFASGAQVMIDQTPATSVTVVDSSTIRAQVPSANAATYNLYVVNSDGSTGIRVNGLTYSGTPTWVTGTTLDNQAVDVAFSIALDATDAVSYANTTELPAGTALLSNGYFYGTVTGIVEETVYNFTVNAVDAENQDSPRTFSVTVTVGPSYQLYTWGINSYGQLGLNDIINRSSPVQVGSETDWGGNDTISSSYFGAGKGTVVSVKQNGTLWSWGENGYGALGFNDRINRSSPVQVGSLTDWSFVFMNPDSFQSVRSVKTDGTLWSWGNNDYAQLGLNDTITRSSPTQVGTGTDWTNKISIGNLSLLAIKSDGTLWGWGYNNYGQLGIGNVINKSSPTQVGSSTDWNVAAIYNHALAIKTNGTLWGWGYFGVNVGVDAAAIGNYRSSPVQVGSDTNWSKVAVDTYASGVIKTNGTLWTWGRDTTCHPFTNMSGANISPTQLGADTNWSEIKFGFKTAAATKTNGTLWSWGLNATGNLGHNDRVNKSSPTQVGTDTNWVLTSITVYSMTAVKQI